MIYNGKARYTSPTSLFQLFASPDLARKALTESYNLIDLESMSDNSIDYQKHSSLLLCTMKHTDDRDMLTMLKDAIRLCSKAVIIDKEQNYIPTR